MSERRKKEANGNPGVVNIDDERERQRKKAKAHQERMRKAHKKRSAKDARRAFIVWLVIVAVLITGIVMAGKILKLETEKKNLEDRHDQLVQELEDVKKEMERSNEPWYIEEKVREKLNMVHKGEVVYITKKELQEEE